MRSLNREWWCDRLRDAATPTTGATWLARDATQRARRPLRKRLFHPLCGANPPTLLRVIRQNGIPRSGRLEIASALAVAATKSPISFAERAYVNVRRHSLGVRHPPVFILGHWRSGTTHLFNLMSRDPRWGYVSPFATALPWDFLLLGRALEPLLARALPENRYFDNVRVDRDSPQEDEVALANMTPLSFYNALYFPSKFRETTERGVFFDGCQPKEIRAWQKMLRYYYDKVSIRAGGAPLLIKNPVYTARLAMLAEMWPGARFVHIHRNPYEVFFSMRNFHQRMLAEFALEPWESVDIDDVVLDVYSRMMDRLVRDAVQLPPERFIEVSFEDLQRTPMETARTIYASLALPGFDAAKPALDDYLRSVDGYRQNRYRYPEADIARVRERWGTYIERWGYAAPRAASPEAIEAR